MTGPFTVPQSGGAIRISSTAARFNKNPSGNLNRYYMNDGGGTAVPSAEFDIEFTDGSGIKLTNFSQYALASSAAANVIGIPSSAEGVFANSVNIIGGDVFFLSNFDIRDLKSGALLIDNYIPQTTLNGYFQPAAQFGYTSGQLTIQAPRTTNVFGSNNSINSTGAFTSNPTLPYVAGNGYTPTAGTGQSSPQYLSGGVAGGGAGGTPWVFSLSVPTPPSPSTPCFYQGTQITLTSGKTISVEDLNIGDLIHTHKGPMPLKWLGRRKVTKSVRQQYPHQLPVVIEKGALGFNMPNTDLMVSQVRTILVEGHLICACLLENDINCYRANCDYLPDDFEYFHLEFAEEEVLLLSNGTPTASYVNTQTRMMFDNYQEYIDLYGDLNAEIKPLEYKHRRTACFLDPYKAVVRRSFQEPTQV